MKFNVLLAIIATLISLKSFKSGVIENTTTTTLATPVTTYSSEYETWMHNILDIILQTRQDIDCKFNPPKETCLM